MIFKIIRFFEREIYNDSVSLDDALEQQIRIKDEIDIFKESTKPQIKEKKALTFEKIHRDVLEEVKKFLVNGFESLILTI